MNIFILDEDPIQAASFVCDQHAICMPKESCQMLSTTHRLLNTEGCDRLMKVTHPNHPCTAWVRASKANYEWAFKNFVALCGEYKSRYLRQHQCSYFAELLEQVPDEIPDIGLTPFAKAMPEQYIGKDPVRSYRKYYLKEKLKFATWTSPSVIPYWVLNHLQRGPYERRVPAVNGQ